MLTSAQPVGAARARNLTLNELTNSSTAVAVVRVQRSEGEWRDGRILTRHEARVEQTWIGSLPSAIELGTLGGVVGELGQQVSGQINLKAGERLVVFLVWDSRSETYRLRGGTNGVCWVSTSADGNVRVRGDLTASVLLDDSLPTLDELRFLVDEVKREN